MIFKNFLLFSCILLSNYIQGQDDSLKLIIDVNSLPVIIYNEKGTDDFDSCTYVKTTGEKVYFDYNVQFIGGPEKLHSYCDSIYFKTLDTNFHELNAIAYYYILFNDSLKIQEIRIFKRLGFDCRYDNIVKTILAKTDGYWEEKEYKKHKWHVYSGIFKIR